jgi:alkylhydroperoxidase family enzyme
MLRESMQTSGKEVDLARVTRGIDESVDVPHAGELAAFAEAVVSRDAARIAGARERLRALLTEAAFVDAAAVAGAFHGFVRIADAIGIPYTGAAGGRDAPDVREEAGINAFYRISSTSAS